MIPSKKFTFVARFFFFLVLAAALVGASSDDRSGSCPAGTRVKWMDYGTVFSTAREKQVPVIIFFHRENCRPCEMLDKNGFQKAEIACYINEKFAPVEVDTDKTPQIAANHKVAAPPTVWFFTPEGKKIDYFTGYVPPEKLNLILHYVGDGAYKEMTYKEFEERQGSSK